MFVSLRFVTISAWHPLRYRWVYLNIHLFLWFWDHCLWLMMHLYRLFFNFLRFRFNVGFTFLLGTPFSQFSSGLSSVLFSLGEQIFLKLAPSRLLENNWKLGEFLKLVLLHQLFHVVFIIYCDFIFPFPPNVLLNLFVVVKRNQFINN